MRGGFDLLSGDDQKDAIAVATGLFFVAFSIVRPLLDQALRVLGDIADNLADLFGAAADVFDLLEKLADDINDELEEAIEDIVGLDLPDELSVEDVIKAAVDVVSELPVIREALGAAFDARDQEAAADANRRARPGGARRG
jgi:hypothetical protein